MQRSDHERALLASDVLRGLLELLDAMDSGAMSVESGHRIERSVIRCALRDLSTDRDG